MSALNEGGIHGDAIDTGKISMYTVTDPATNAATTSTIIGVYGGAIITTTTTGNSQTLASPTDTTAGKIFVIVNNDTSTNTIPVVANSVTYTIGIGVGQAFIWDGTKWMPTDLGITAIPVTVIQGGTGLSTITDHSVMVGSGTGAVTPIAVGTDNQILTGVTGADPIFKSTIDGVAIGGTTPQAGTFTTAKADHIGETTGSHGVVVDNNLDIGSTTAGKNLTVNPTESAEMTPALESANWTLGTDGTGGWAASGGVLSKTASAGTQTATPSGTFTVVAGRTYRVTMVVSAASGSPTYTIGGRQGTTITATTISEDIIAGTTGKIIFSGGASATCTITSLSVKELTPETGNLTVGGDLTVRHQLILPYGGSATIPAIQLGSSTTSNTGVIWQAAGLLRIGSSHAFYGSQFAIQSDTAGFLLGAGNDVSINRDAADTLALRRSTSQQMLSIYNTYTDASNYERMSLTGVAGSSINITAATAGTGGDNLDVVITPAGTGAIKPGAGFGFARATPITHAATEAATAATLYGTTHLVTGAYTVTLPAVAIGMHGRFYATTAAAFSVDCNESDHFVLGGTALTAGNKVTSDGSAGAMFEWECTAANTITIFFSNVTFIDGGA